MSRAIILILCLVTAGAIAAYSNDVRDPAESADKVKVYAVPARIEAPVIPAAPAPPSVTVDAPTDKATLTRQLQRELKRVGCYTGDVNGVWTTSSRLAMKAFVDHANASLPIHAPDPVLLSLVRSHPDGTCAAPCPRGRVCEPIPPAGKSGDEQASIAPAAVTSAVAVSAAVPAAAASSKVTTKSAPPDLAASPPPAETARTDQRHPETESRKAVRERKSRQTWKDPVKPPRFVRDFLRTVERTFKLP
jgi:hypothetical protein